MKKLITSALTFCAFIVAMACGSNDPDVDGKDIRETDTGDSVSASRMLIAQVLILNH